MAQPRLGPAHLCVQRQVPMVPVILRGTYAAMPRARNWPMPGRQRVIVRYGRPLFPEENEGARGLHQRMVQAMSRLWAEDELGWYGSLRAQAKGELTLPSGPKQITADGSGSAVPSGSWRRSWEASRPLPKETKHSRVWD
jgi:1-acyl-sn-glycerol-3-phosphate acyltransferase